MPWPVKLRYPANALKAVTSDVLLLFSSKAIKVDRGDLIEVFFHIEHDRTIAIPVNFKPIEDKVSVYG